MEEEKMTKNKDYIYCSKCGEKLSAKSRFCNSCGMSTNLNKDSVKEETKITNRIEEYPIERKTVYDGKIHKCPNCGEVLEAFVGICPACGFEIRDRNSSSSLREFYLKLEQIELGREKKKIRSIFTQSLIGDNLSKTDEQKISLIRSFVIPNTKEDLYEFLILSKSNIEIDLYEDTQVKTARLAVSDAWKAKFEQAYHKAKLLFKDDERMGEIQVMYDETNKAINDAKRKIWKILGIVYGFLFGMIIVILIIVAISDGFDSSDDSTQNNNSNTAIKKSVSNSEKDSIINISDSEIKNLQLIMKKQSFHKLTHQPQKMV